MQVKNADQCLRCFRLRAVALTYCPNAAAIPESNERRKKTFRMAFALGRLFHKPADEVVELASRVWLIEILPAVDDPEDAEILRSDLASIEFG